MHPEGLCMPKKGGGGGSEENEIHRTFSIYIVHYNLPRNEDERQTIFNTLN